jgi:hypothetical protein
MIAMMPNKIGNPIAFNLLCKCIKVSTSIPTIYFYRLVGVDDVLKYFITILTFHLFVVHKNNN